MGQRSHFSCRCFFARFILRHTACWGFFLGFFELLRALRGFFVCNVGKRICRLDFWGRMTAGLDVLMSFWALLWASSTRLTDFAPHCGRRAVVGAVKRLKLNEWSSEFGFLAFCTFKLTQSCTIFRSLLHLPFLILFFSLYWWLF